MRATIDGVYKPTNNHAAVALSCFCEQRYFLSSRAAVRKPSARYLSWLLTQWRVRAGAPGTRPPALSAGSRHGRCRLQAQHYWLVHKWNPAARDQHRSGVRRGQREEMTWSGLEAQVGCGWEQSGEHLPDIKAQANHSLGSEGDIDEELLTHDILKESTENRKEKMPGNQSVYIIWIFPKVKSDPWA